jgi:hypothetical protein
MLGFAASLFGLSGLVLGGDRNDGDGAREMVKLE